MKKILMTFVLVCMAMISVSLHAQVNPEKNKQRLIEEIYRLKQQLPIEMFYGRLTNVYYEDHLLFAEVELDQDLVRVSTEILSLALDSTYLDTLFATSVDGLAKEILSFLRNDFEMMKWIFLSEITHEKIGEYTFSQSQLEKTLQQLRKGEIKPYSSKDILYLCSRSRAVKNFSEYKQELSFPIQISEEMSLTDYLFDGDTLICKYEVSETIAQKNIDKLSSEEEVVMSIARVGFDDFLKLGFVVKYVTYLEGGKEKVLEIIMTDEKYKELLKKIRGPLLEEIKAFVAEFTEPIQVNDGSYLTQTYLIGTSVYYVYTADGEVLSELQQKGDDLKKSLAQANAMDFAEDREEIINENITFVYIWQDKNQQTVIQIECTPQDMFPTEANKSKKTKR